MQRVTGNRNLIGMRVESNLAEGSQKIPTDRSQLRYGGIGYRSVCELGNDRAVIASMHRSIDVVLL